MSDPTGRPPQGAGNYDAAQVTSLDVSSLRRRERLLTGRLKLLVSALVLTSVPLLVALAILPGRIQENLTALGEARLTQVAEDLASFTENTMRLQLETVQGFSTLHSVRGAILRRNAGTLTGVEITALNRELHGLVGRMSTELQGILVCGSDGISFAGVLQDGDPAPYVRLDVRDRAYYAEVVRTMQPLVSDPMYSKVLDVPVVAIVAPIADERGAFAGFIAMSIKTRHLCDLIARNRIGKAGYPFALDRQGLLVAHPDPNRFLSDSLKRNAQAARLVGRMLRGERGIEPYVSSFGASKIAAFAPASVCGWSIAASIEVAEFEAPARQIRLILLVLLAACLLTGLVLAGTLHQGLKRLNLALEEAQASELRFRLFANIAGCAVWDCKLSDRDIWWNEGLARTFGLEPRQLSTYEAFFERLPEAEQAVVRAGLRRCREEGAWTGEHHFRRADGEWAFILHRASAILGQDGTVVRIIGSMTDISDRRRAEQKLAEQAELLNKTRDSIVVQGLDGTIRFWNAGAHHLYGWSVEEALGRKHDELLSAEPLRYAEALAIVREKGAWAGRIQKVSKAGTRISVEARWTLLVDALKQPYAILAMGTDITERLQMEERLLRTQRLESIGTLAGGIAHDLNNLLSPVLAGAGILRMDPLTREQAETVDIIERSAQHGADLVAQVLAFARGVQGSLVSVHVGYVLREVESIIRSTFPKNIAVRTEVARDLRLIQADPTQIHQVLLNLCVNARDAMQAGGALSVGVRNMAVDEAFAASNRELTPGPYVRIDVTDTGVGIPENVRQKIFEPFFTTKAPGKGTGLGLSTVLGIVRSLGGSVSVYSEPGRGSVFRVYLPAKPGVEDAVQERPGARAAARGAGELILVCDDERLVLDVSRRVLEANGYRVLTAGDGGEALELHRAHAGEVALLVTDLMMPKMDGASLIGAVRATAPGLPVVAMSGFDESNQLDAMEGAIDVFMNKPFSAGTLLATVGKLLRR